MAFNFLKSIEVELPDKALELAVSKKIWSDFCLHELWVENINVGFCGVPGDDVSIGGVLNEWNSYIEQFFEFVNKISIFKLFLHFEIIIYHRAPLRFPNF